MYYKQNLKTGVQSTNHSVLDLEHTQQEMKGKKLTFCLWAKAASQP